MSSGGRARIENPRFELGERLGEGGNGVVYAAYDRERGARVAVKTLRRPGPRALLRLKQEFRALADVAHPNLLTLYDLFVEGDACYFTMELVEGVDFATWVRGAGTSPRAVTGHAGDTFQSGVVTTAESRVRPRPAAAFDEARLRSALAQLVDGIGALHRQRKVHRDLKPSNVLVRADGQVRILDYGLVTGRLEEPGGFEGTAAYAAPEQTDGVAGPEADGYAIGVMLFEAMTGVLPFEGSPLQMLVDKAQRDAPRVDSLVSGAPPDLVELCARLLSRDPGSRGISDVAARDPVVGRSRELSVLDAALSRSVREARVLVVEGPSGIGKTTLVRAFLESARARGAVVLETRCSPRETVPYNAFDGAIDDLARVLRARNIAVDDPALGRMFPVLSTEAPMSRSDVDADVVRRRAFAALRRLLERVGSPLIVFVDDFQWADRDSQALLAEIVRVPALFLLTQRSPGPALPWASERLVVPPLDPAAARALVTAAGGEVDVERLLGVAAGHPLFLQELARHGGSAADLDDVLRARVAALPEELRRIVELTALAVVPLPAHVLALAAGIDVAEAERATELLRVDRLVVVGARGVEPFHDRVREAVLASIAEPRALHAALVRALSGRDEHALVHHLAGAGDVAAAIAAALGAARRAEEALAFERAALLLRDAIDLGARDDDVNTRLAEALESAHRGVEAAEAHLRNGELRARARAGELLLASGEIERGRTILGAVLREAGYRLPGSPARAIAELAVERTRLAVRGLEPAKGHDPEAARREDLFRAVAQGLGMADNLCAAVYNARALRAALDSGEPARAARALAVEAIFQGSVDVRRRPHALLARARALADVADDATAHAWIAGADAVLGALTLEQPSAIDALLRAEGYFQERTRGNGWALDSLKLVRALSLRLLGDLETLRRMLPDDIEDARRRGDRYLETTMLRGATMIRLCDGDVDRARAMLEESAWPATAGFHIQHWLALEGNAEIDLYLGRAGDTLERHAAEFAALRRSLIVRLQRPRILARTTRGKLLLARGGRAALLECAWLASRLEAEGVGYAHARSALLRAGIASRRGSDPAPDLRRAIAIAERHGLGLTGAVARFRLSEATGDREALEASRAWMARMRVHDPERVCAMEAP